MRDSGWHEDVRQVTATARFAGPPGMEREAAEAWAFELTYYFTRGVSEPPQVTYEDGVYTCTGLMQTTHPGDHDPVVFDRDAPPWALSFISDENRRQYLRELYGKRARWFDGRDHA